MVPNVWHLASGCAHRDVQRILAGRFHIVLAEIVEEFDWRFVGTHSIAGDIEEKSPQIHY
jgi:hypothetical protein